MKNKHFLRGMATVNYWADNVTAARDWYSELFGIEAYFQQPSAEHPAYIEFRIGDDEDEFGIIDRKYRRKVCSQGLVVRSSCGMSMISKRCLSGSLPWAPKSMIRSRNVGSLALLPPQSLTPSATFSVSCTTLTTSSYTVRRHNHDNGHGEEPECFWRTRS